jgi:methylglyoxal synthase
MTMMKDDLLEYAKYHYGTLSRHNLSSSGSAGGFLKDEFDLPINKFMSGPICDDQQIGEHVAQGEINVLIFSGTQLCLLYL